MRRNSPHRQKEQPSIGRTYAEGELPSMDDIKFYGMPEEEYAIKHFYGKNIEEASALFFESSMTYQEDLLYMGPNAFFYYINSIKPYILSAEGWDDDCFVMCVLGIFENRLKHEPNFRDLLECHKESILEILLIFKKNIENENFPDSFTNVYDIYNYANFPERLSRLIELCE